ncbi:MAG: Mur ligase family protein [Eubacteriales bacterium]
MGISDFGEMTRLARMAKPTVCVLTNIGLCHLENLKTRDGILKAKTEMFEQAMPGAQIIVNGDDDKLITLKDPGRRSRPSLGWILLWISMRSMWKIWGWAAAAATS